MPLHPQAQDLLDTLTSAPTPLNRMPPEAARAAYRRFIEARNYDPEPVEYSCYDGTIHGYFHYGKIIDAATASLNQVIDALKRAFAGQEPARRETGWMHGQ